MILYSIVNVTIENAYENFWKNDLIRISFDIYEQPQEIRYKAALWIYEHLINKLLSSLSVCRYNLTLYYLQNFSSKHLIRHMNLYVLEPAD